MAPLKASQRRSQAPSEHIYTLGERGRKTGVTLRDTGVRDEHGMQPLEDLFSSPDKSRADGAAGGAESNDSSGEADMDLTTASGPDPAALINGQNGNRLPLPRSRSPLKTHLKSPAVRNQNFQPSSSPVRGAVVTPREASPLRSVSRRLDFGKAAQALPRPKAAGGARPANGQHRIQEEDETRGNGDATANADNDEDEEAILRGREEHGDDTNGDVDLSMQMVDVGNGEDAASPAAPGADNSVEDDEPARPEKKRGRPPKGKAPAVAADDSEPREVRSPKRRRGHHASPEQEEEEEEPEQREQPEPKRQRTQAKGRGRPAAGKTKAGAEGSEERPRQQKQRHQTEEAAEGPKKRGRKRKSSTGAADTSVADPVPRAPPLPRNRGLLIKRREVPGDGASSITQTRSGRNSYKPLAFWRNEHVEYEQAVVAGDPKGRERFVVSELREIHRIEEEEPPKRAHHYHHSSKSGRKAKRRISGDDDDREEQPREPWEDDPGEVIGEVVLWNPEHELRPPAVDDELDVVEEQIAISAAAVQTRDIRDATFRFAKTLSLPFFGCGVVDLPPGAEKRPKNSRKMHMTFFVYSGRVQVTVNESRFRIGKGGMWFVPRGNHYSIENDYDHPARIFFAQGCEILVERPPEGEGEGEGEEREGEENENENGEGGDGEGEGIRQY